MNTIKNLKITCLAEDTSPRLPFWGAHGLSMLVEADDKKILFDTNSFGEVLSHNAEELEVNLQDIDYFLLSHTHDDHSGGLSGIQKLIRNKPMICTTDAFSEEMPNNEELKQIMSNVQENIENREIFPGVTVIGEQDGINPKYPVKEIALVINLEGKGLVVVLGCSHPGINNIINDVKDMFPDVPIHGIVGGLHLKDSSADDIKKVALLFKQENIKIILANHCTGFKALKELTSDLPEATEFISNTVSGSFHSGKEFVF
jgi:7,8-dihydropterin-6-yl-methyl-4-(beta-D-ribofuranosyl)aminobenzene 5'-phosphate synthase